MKALLKALSYFALVLTIVPAILVFFGHIQQEFNKLCMLVGFVLWFATAGSWIGKNKS